MDTLQKWLAWARENSILFLDCVRIYIGVGLLIRGVVFLMDSSFLTEWLTQFGIVGNAAMVLRFGVVIIHVIGGFLLTFGVATRIAAAIQVPILAGAVLFIHFPEGLAQTDQSLEFSSLVLFLLILFSIRGAKRLTAQSMLGREATVS
jgi:uncharacterized membrane protein YphA (DoxX/SURF4 family)